MSIWKFLFVTLLIAVFLKTGVAMAEDSRVLAKVGEDIITVSQFTKMVSHLSRFQQLQLIAEEESRKKFLDRLVDARLVYREALRMGMDKDPEVIEEIELAKEQILIPEYIERESKPKVKVTRCFKLYIPL